MTRAPLTLPAYAASPDADRAGTDASARLPGWCACFIASVIRFIFAHLFGSERRSSVPAWWHDRPDLPPGSAMALAASIRGEFGTAIGWMCRRRGIGPGHPNWPELARYIVAFGGSVKGARPGLPACGLQWWENPNVVPGLVAETPATPAATAMASLLSRLAVGGAPPPAPEALAAVAGPVLFPASRLRGESWPIASWRRRSTGPPLGPPASAAANFLARDERGQSMAGPAVPIRANRKAPASPAAGSTTGPAWRGAAPRLSIAATTEAWS